MKIELAEAWRRLNEGGIEKEFEALRSMMKNESRA
jgi:hypothetical protein